MTGTYTGQFVMAGFLDLRVKKWLRVLVTRLVAIVPTVAVALAFDSSEKELDNLSEWLNVLQSIQLPFALIPLLCLVSNSRVMGVFVIDTITKVIAWSIALLVMAINMYLLVVTVFGNIVESAAVMAILLVVTALYISFIVYLILEPAQEDGNWVYIKRTFLSCSSSNRVEKDSEVTALVSSTSTS